MNPVKQMNGGFQTQPLKEEEPEGEEHHCKTGIGLNIISRYNLTYWVRLGIAVIKQSVIIVLCISYLLEMSELKFK